MEEHDPRDPEDGTAHDNEADAAVRFSEVVEVTAVPVEKKSKFSYESFKKATFDQDLEKQSFHESERTRECWENASKYDSEVEQLFTYVQVFTASLNSFAHGANDIANVSYMFFFA